VSANGSFAALRIIGVIVATRRRDNVIISAAPASGDGISQQRGSSSMVSKKITGAVAGWAAWKKGHVGSAAIA